VWGCGNCLPYCTMGAIRIENSLGVVNEEECVECNTCYRCCVPKGRQPELVRAVRRLLSRLRLRYESPMGTCPTGALAPPELEWPRSLRRAFSDPTVTHDETGVAGRGTEKIKTNDITGRIGPGQAGVVIDLGRPGTGCFLSDISIMTQALAVLDIEFESDNPLTAIMENSEKGILLQEVLGEKVLSAIIEFKISLEQLPGVLETVKTIAAELNTVVCIGVSSRCAEDGAVPHEAVCREAGFLTSLNGKTNLGFGHPTPAGDRK
jgi:ferredoxin